MPNKTAPKTSQDAIFPIFSSYNQFFTLTLQANKKRRMKNIFKIKKEERIPGLVALLVFVLLNGLFFYKYGNLFLRAHHVSFWLLFAKTSMYPALMHGRASLCRMANSISRFPAIRFLQSSFIPSISSTRN